jgi:hypothetical protein
MINHNDKPNVEWRKTDDKLPGIEVISLDRIEDSSQIFMHYG